jgi:hypothetical protein
VTLGSTQAPYLEKGYNLSVKDLNIVIPQSCVSVKFTITNHDASKNLDLRYWLIDKIA